MAKSVTAKSNTTGNNEAPLLEHLEELRNRIIISLIFLTLGTGVAWTYRVQMLDWLKAPLKGVHAPVHIIALRLTDQLLMSFTLSLWGGLILALPFILHQVWLFVSPGLYPQERRWAVPFILGAGVSFGLGVAFSYFVILPSMVKFLLDFLGGEVVNNLSIYDYVGQVVNVLLAMGVVFELPILSFILTKIGVVNAGLLSRVRKVAIIVILVVAAVITPTTDPVNLMLVAVPIYLLYEIGIIVARLAAPRERQLVAQNE